MTNRAPNIPLISAINEFMNFFTNKILTIRVKKILIPILMTMNFYYRDQSMQ